MEMVFKSFNWKDTLFNQVEKTANKSCEQLFGVLLKRQTPRWKKRQVFIRFLLRCNDKKKLENQCILFKFWKFSVYLLE